MPLKKTVAKIAKRKLERNRYAAKTAVKGLEKFGEALGDVALRRQADINQSLKVQGLAFKPKKTEEEKEIVKKGTVGAALLVGGMGGSIGAGRALPGKIGKSLKAQPREFLKEFPSKKKKRMAISTRKLTHK